MKETRNGEPVPLPISMIVGHAGVEVGSGCFEGHGCDQGAGRWFAGLQNHWVAKPLGGKTTGWQNH